MSDTSSKSHSNDSPPAWSQGAGARLYLIFSLVASEAVIDALTPRGYADWMLYAIPILLTTWYSRRITIVVTATVTLLSLIGFILSPVSPFSASAPWIGVLNRLIGICIFWTMAVLINRRRHTLERLQQAHMRLEEQAAELVKTERKKTEFLADTSHELRTPLAIIKSHIDLALRKKSRRFIDPYDALRDIDTEINHLSQVISDLIFLSRSDSDPRQTLVLQQEDLKGLLESAVDKYAVLATDAGMAITNDAFPLTAQVDAEKISKVFSNLLVNAIQYGREGGHVLISMRKNPASVEILFEDDGIGIPADDLPHIFERFYRVEGTRSKVSGVGLGLAICKQITEAHGGTITVKSIYGNGASFCVSLPTAART